MINQFRMILAEFLLGLIIKIIPNNDSGNLLLKYIHAYFNEISIIFKENLNIKN